MPEEINYEADLRIDETALDVEWLNQPNLMLRYSRMLANARLRMEQCKETFDVVKAELDNKIRKNPEKYGLPKITDASVANTIPIQKEYKYAFKAYLNAKYEADMAFAAVRAFEQRKEALENLVKLHGQQYFAGPKMPRDISAEWINAQKRRDSNSKIIIERTK